MKRYKNLYQNICEFDNIEDSFKEVRRNTNNYRRVFNMKQYKTYYLSTVFSIVKSKNYVVGPYNKFVIHEPKKRQIVSQNIVDKIINHLVARHILYPAILPCLLDVNVASRKDLGTSAGLKIAENFRRKCKIKYGHYYVLKCDISKFFCSIDHDILKEKLKKRIKDKDAIDIVFRIIDSNEPGLFIGSMTSQVLAIFYLNDLDHFIKEQLKIKYYIRYQDDFLLYHPSKKYLTYCLTEIRKFLEKEKLNLNDKTRIYKDTNNFTFLGRNSKGHYVRYRNIKRKLKHKYYYYQKGRIPLNEFVSSLSCYADLVKKEPQTLFKQKNSYDNKN